MDSSSRHFAEDDIAVLVHQLRQPLSSIALSASYLNLILEPAQDRAQRQLELIQEQVDRLSDMLDRTAAELRRRGVQRAERSVENLDLTKPHTAVVA